MRDIRSIKKLDLEFPSSSILFFGDIGSGKSSVLKAIEFALFGILNAADLSGTSLLRRGEKTGKVELTFSVNGKSYTIGRSLKKRVERKNSEKKIYVFQEDGFFIEDGKETQYSPNDLRRKVLEILNYSITRYENARKIPLFRYTVYTPQEEIKEILKADPEERFEILKEVFDIEKYEIALKNVDVIRGFLRDKIKEIEIVIKQIGEPSKEIPETKKKISEHTDKINKIKNQIKIKNKEILSEEEKLDELQKELSNYSNKLVEIDNKENLIKETTNNLNKNENSLKSLRSEIKNLENKLRELPEIEKTIEKTENDFKEEIKSKRHIISKKEKKEAVIRDKINNIKSLLKDGKCSLCGQEIHEKERFENELKSHNDTLKQYNDDLSNLKNDINTLEEDLRIKTANDKLIDKKTSLSDLIEEKGKREKDLTELIDEQKKKIKQNREDIRDIINKYEIQNLDDFREYKVKITEKLQKQKNIVKQKDDEKIQIEKALTAEEKVLEQNREELKKLEQDLKRKDSLTQRLEYLNDLYSWVSDKFQILLRDIEREILASSAHEFNEYFKEWFNILVENESIDIEIRPDNFEPLINVNGYESPFEDLSGGEKSALSLAYRLALNKIINSRHQEVKTKNLLILDEPTDGFSQEQINKMQDVLGNLDTEQMFIISHDRNLDSFVTDILNFKKENHRTKVIQE
ncbi:MAG: AAA family ATPase [Promethearchaeia archaeon]